MKVPITKLEENSLNKIKIKKKIQIKNKNKCLNEKLSCGAKFSLELELENYCIKSHPSKMYGLITYFILRKQGLTKQ